MSHSYHVWFRENAFRFSGKLLFEEPLARYTYYQIGGRADVFCIPKTISDLEWLAEGIKKTQIPFFFIGQGSNLLVSDHGFRGLIVKMSQLNSEIKCSLQDSYSYAEVEAGVFGTLITGGSLAISSLLRKMGEKGWGGLEFLAGIPGTVGGAVWMNAGTSLGESKSRLNRVQVYELSEDSLEFKCKFFEKEELLFDYRKNFFLTKKMVLWSAQWDVIQREPETVKCKIYEILAHRKKTQPIEYPSCGSVFKNPKASNLKAWQVIDQIGLRGHTLGQAQFSIKHSNFIVNLGKAKAQDVRGLIDLAKIKAKQGLNIDLEEEVIYVE